MQANTSQSRSLQKSDHDQFALFQEQISISLFCSQKKSNSLKKTKEQIPNPGKTWDFESLVEVQYL